MKPTSGGISGKIKITKKPASGGLDGGKTIRPPKRAILNTKAGHKGV
jgi:hypothetical protein